MNASQMVNGAFSKQSEGLDQIDEVITRGAFDRTLPDLLLGLESGGE